MRNAELEIFYKWIEKNIDIVIAYTGNKKYRSIIKSCRLKPIEVFTIKAVGELKTQLCKIWADEYGNSLDIVSGNITLNDLKNPPISRRTTDLFYSIPFNEHIRKGIRGLFLGNSFPEMIALYGRDEYIRCVNVSGFGMTRISPLEFGIEPISKLIDGKIGAIISNNYANGIILKVNDDLKIEELFDGR